MADKELSDRIAAAVEDAETTPDEELDWTRHQVPAKSPAAVYSVRIPVERIDELRQLAAERGVAPTVLIRTWVLAQLDAARSPDDYAQRWERDMRATAEQLRKLLNERPGAPQAKVS
jgi:chemotaxis protein histidine kinase CheA